MNRNSTIADAVVGDVVSWFVIEEVPTGWIYGPAWTFTVTAANYPGDGSENSNLSGAVPVPNILKTVVVCDDKIYVGRL